MLQSFSKATKNADDKNTLKSKSDNNFYDEFVWVKIKNPEYFHYIT